MHNTFALFNNLMGMDGLIILVLGLLFFGRRLPEAAQFMFRPRSKPQPVAFPFYDLFLIVLFLLMLALFAKIFSSP